jgi:hypothetical protein
VSVRLTVPTRDPTRSRIVAVAVEPGIATVWVRGGAGAGVTGTLVVVVGCDDVQAIAPATAANTVT